MKRLLLILVAAVLAAGNSSAQNKPEKGSWSTEVQINPFEQNGNTFSLDGLKIRYFLSDKDALRLKVSFSTTSNKYTNEEDNYEDGTGSKFKKNENYKYKLGDFNIDLGYERHFGLAKRLDAYVGASVGLGKNFASTKMDSFSKNYYESSGYSTSTEVTSIIELKNGAITEDGNITKFEDAQRASFNISGAVFAGLEFYVYKGLYIGTELGIGCQTAKTLKMELDGKTIVRTTVNGKVTINETTVDKETTDSYRTTSFKSYIEPKLRIGISF